MKYKMYIFIISCYNISITKPTEKIIMNFIGELNKQTRTPDQIEQEEIKTAINKTQSIISEIQRGILRLAKDGDYTYCNGKKVIIYYKTFAPWDHKRYIQTQTIMVEERIGLFQKTQKRKEQMIVNPQHAKEYRVFIKEIQELGEKEHIKIEPILLNSSGNEYAIPTPIAYYAPMAKLTLKCTVEY